MVVKVYTWLITLFYLYIAYRGIMLILSEWKELKHKSMIYQHCFNNKFKYLSIWVSHLQVFYFVLASICDVIDYLPFIFKYPRSSYYIYTVRNYLLTSLVLPLTLYVSVVFWAFYLYDRESIYPEHFDSYIPPWLNHATHSYPVLILLVHLATCPNSNPSRCSALVGLTLVFVVYGAMFWLSVMKGNWVYLVFDHLNTSQRMLLLSISYPLIIFFLILSRGFNNVVKNLKVKFVRQEGKEMEGRLLHH